MSLEFETICERVHQAWMKEKHDQGFHAPDDCPNFNYDDKRSPVSKFSRHCGFCHTDLYPYEELPEHIKEYDRVTVRTVLKAMEE